MNLVIDEQKGTFTITGDIPETLTQSNSGKSILLHTTGGTARTQATFKGHQVSVNLNLTIPNQPAEVVAGAAAGDGKVAAKK